MSSENRKPKDSTTTTTPNASANASINVSQIVDAANENVTKLVNESSRVQPQYAQAISNLQQEYIDALRNAIQRTFSVQKQLVTSNSNFNNFAVPEAVAPYVQGLVKQSDDITNNFISVADTNNHAIRVVDLRTKETATLQLKGLQPPALKEDETTTEAGPNAEEITLPPQKLRASDSALVINVDLPPGYHLNPAAPQRYAISIKQGTNESKTPPVNANQAGKGVSLPLRVPLGVTAGAATVRASFTFVYCRDDNTGVCRIKSVQWQAPVEVVNDGNATNEIKVSAKVVSE